MTMVYNGIVRCCSDFKCGYSAQCLFYLRDSEHISSAAAGRSELVLEVFDTDPDFQRLMLCYHENHPLGLHTGTDFMPVQFRKGETTLKDLGIPLLKTIETEFGVAFHVSILTGEGKLFELHTILAADGEQAGLLNEIKRKAEIQRDAPYSKGV